jgi:hypothetical protein
VAIGTLLKNIIEIQKNQNVSDKTKLKDLIKQTETA